MHEHEHDEYSWWICDGRNIPIAKVCDTCEEKVMADIRLRYRPEIVDSWYDESDVDEPIDHEGGYGWDCRDPYDY